MCTRQQRGGIYSDNVVSGMRSCSMGGVKRAISEGVGSGHLPKNLQPPSLRRQLTDTVNMSRSPGQLFGHPYTELYPGALGPVSSSLSNFNHLVDDTQTTPTDPMDMV